MADNSDDPGNGQALYSEDDGSPPTTATAPNKATNGLSQGSSTSSLSEVLDPDADAEGEPDDLDADADGIEDDDVMDYSFEPPERILLPEEDDEDGSGEEEMDDPEDEDAEEEDEDSGEEMDLDENASSPPPSPPSRNSELPQQSTSNKKPLVLKLKLASQTSTAAPPAKRKYVRKPPDSKSPSGRSRTINDKKTGSSLKRRDTDEDDDDFADDVLDLESETDDDPSCSGTHTGLYQAWDESDGASSSDDAIPAVGQLTVRQRAKEYGEPVTELQSLPMSDGKKKKELTEADRAMEKAEKSRKRKHQNEKKLEDEKTETINRLLKGQIGKAGKGSSSKIAGGSGDPAEESNNQIAKPPAPPPPPTMIRRISSIRSGEYVSCLSVPSSILNDQQVPILFKSSSNSITYPPKIRPPPKTWKLVNGVRVN